MRFVFRLLALYQRFLEIYCTVDPRSLGLARISLGLLLLYDLVRRVPDLSTWYSNDGLLPNHAVLWRPSADWLFSFFFAASEPGEAALMFVFSGLVYVGLLIGWHTRFFHALSFVCLVSLHSRVVFLENGGDVVLNLFCAWTLFLPMGVRFSVDAVRRSLRERPEHSAEELDLRTSLAFREQRPFVSLAFFAILLELAVIYHFNAVHKQGFTWREGSAVHYVLYQERMVTWFGLLVRPHMTPLLSKVLTYATLAIEFAAAPLILNPFVRLRTRRIAIVLLPALHLGFAAFLNLGQFSFNMIGFFPLLLTAEDWSLVNRVFRRRENRARRVLFDERSALAFAWARLLARVDTRDLLQFSAKPAPEGGRGPFWEVENPATARRTNGARALSECLDALPFCRPLALFLRLPGVRNLADLVGRRITEKEGVIVAAFGLLPMGAPPPEIEPESPARAWLQRRAVTVRELAAAGLMVVLTSQVLMENKAVPAPLKLGQTKWMQQIITYPRLFQGWGMFSADVPTGERMLYVDAITFGGRHVDPFNEAGSRVASLPVDRIPPWMDQDEFWCDYTNRIFDNQAYWRMLKEWIFRYHYRTLRPEDRVISFQAFQLDSDSPPPGETEPRNIRTKVLMSERE